ncbi:hypothetical protein [Mycobacterium sp. JS623]|nr:hypothetical protein [Mycobacterium sp. JS623]
MATRLANKAGRTVDVSGLSIHNMLYSKAIERLIDTLRLTGIIEDECSA